MPIDLRSDTVTRPSAGMRAAMAAAEVGDDVYGDDPTVNELQRFAAELLGHEAALFFPSGTQSNLAALMTHCQRGDEVILGEHAHTYQHEGGGAAVLGSIQPQPLEQNLDGTIDLDRIREAVKPGDDHFARTRLLAVENTFGGRVMPRGWMLDAITLARSVGLTTHLDGARVFNAAVSTGTPAQALVAPFTSASICLSKGLGAPVGSLLLGSRDFIREARRWRKMLGGGLRQVGVLAAAGLYALKNNVTRLSDDHATAKQLADGLRDLPGLSVEAPQTNIVWVHLPEKLAPTFCEKLARLGVLASGTREVRFVTHLDITPEHIAQAIKAVEQVVAE